MKRCNKVVEQIGCIYEAKDRRKGISVHTVEERDCKAERESMQIGTVDRVVECVSVDRQSIWCEGSRGSRAGKTREE